MRKSNNYYKFMEYVSCGKRHDTTICKDNGVLECTSYCTVSDIEYYENTKLEFENEWLTIKNVLINEEVIYVYYVKGERTFYIEQFFLDNFKTQRDLRNAIQKAVDKFFINNVDILKDKETSAPEATEEPEEPEATEEPEAIESTEEPATRGERGNMMMNAINYVQENKLHKEANLLANKVGDIYMACVIIYKNIPQTEENLEICKKIVEQKKEADKKAFYDFING